MNREESIQEVIEILARVQRPAKLSSLQKIGLSHSQLGVLFALAFHERLQISQIAEFLGITKSAASQLMDPLTKKGLIDRQTDPEDRRVAYFSVTAEGKKTLKKLHKFRYAGLRSRLENLPSRDLDKLVALVRKIEAKK